MAVIAREGRRAKAEREPDELIETWTLTGDDWDLVGNKSGAARLGRFPAYQEEVPLAAVRYLASPVLAVDRGGVGTREPWRRHGHATSERLADAAPKAASATPYPASTSPPTHQGGAYGNALPAVIITLEACAGARTARLSSHEALNAS